MTFWKLVLRSLGFHIRPQSAVALGVAAAAAVLVGALLVGDSVRGTLRYLTLDRLGRIDELVISDFFFRQELAAEIRELPIFKEHYTTAAAVVLLPSTSVEKKLDDSVSRSSGVLALGIDADFWVLGDDKIKPAKSPADGEIAINETLAKSIQAKVGDLVTLRLGKVMEVPADSPLGRKEDRLTALVDLKLVAIIPSESLGRFGLEPSQFSPSVAYVSRAQLASVLDMPGKANGVLIAGKNREVPPSEEVSRQLQQAIAPKLEDLGLNLTEVTLADPTSEGQLVLDYFSLSSERMMLSGEVQSLAEEVFQPFKSQTLLTYLANNMEKVTEEVESNSSETTEKKSPTGVPYSTITAIDPMVGGPLVDAEGKPLPPLADDEIAVNSWMAEDQKLTLGDRVRVTYFKPESTHGTEEEASAEFKVAAIIPIVEPKSPFQRRRDAIYDQRPTTANDTNLTPVVKGITDQASIADWDAPFPFDYNRIRTQDDDYWENHRTTPKAFISLAAGEKLWSSRFGRATSVRVNHAADLTAEKLTAQLLEARQKQGLSLGLVLQSIKRQSLAASAGTTPFDVLFLALSMFIIAAALMLVWLLFSLVTQQRAADLGLLMALGWTEKRTARSLLAEGMLLAGVGSLLGALLGVGYAAAMLAGLKSWWSGAVSSPDLSLYITPTALIGGTLASFLIAMVTMAISLRLLRRVSLRQLLAGESTPAITATSSARRSWLLLAIAGVLLLIAVGSLAAATTLGGEAQAGALLSAGAAILTSLLLVVTHQLRQNAMAPSALSPNVLLTMAWRSASRNVGRSITTISLMASASFLIIAVSSFRMAPTEEGIGGFDLLAESSQPIIGNLGTDAGRKELLADEAESLAKTTILSLRVKAGDDASCRNLYRPSQPQVLGVTPALIEYFDQPTIAKFAFAGSAAKTEIERKNPWHVLDSSAAAGAPVRVIVDKNTAMYSLRLYRGVGERFTVNYEGGPTVEFEVAGLLAGSVLQGSLLVGERDFERLFPQVSGYSMFLIRPDGVSADKVSQLLETRLGDEGFDCIDARARLSDLLAVQNTYITTFQSLGGLGLLLGTLGLAAVQLRSALERRKELALLRAIGFSTDRLRRLLMLESLVLLALGLGLGVVAAMFVVLPPLVLGEAKVPLRDLALMLALVAVVGIAAGAFAARLTLRAPLLAALRGE